MARVKVVFKTPPTPVSPDTEGLFAGCSRTSSVTYSRHFDLDYNRFWISGPNSEIDLYGEKYKITALGLTKKEVTVTLPAAQIQDMIAKARQARNRWTRKVENVVDGRRVFSRLMRESALH